MRKREREKYRKILDERLSELTAHYNDDLKRSRAVKEDGAEDTGDFAFTSYTKEFLLNLGGLERKELQLVKDSIRRIDSGEFGECFECKEPIAEKRLTAVPWALYCITCKELEEKGLLENQDGAN